jgi:hypothetical protein
MTVPAAETDVKPPAEEVQYSDTESESDEKEVKEEAKVAEANAVGEGEAEGAKPSAIVAAAAGSQDEEEEEEFLNVEDDAKGPKLVHFPPLLAPSSTTNQPVYRLVMMREHEEQHLSYGGHNAHFEGDLPQTSVALLKLFDELKAAGQATLM